MLPEPNVPYDVLVQVMDALRAGHQVQGTKVVEVALFPDISIGDAPIRPGARAMKQTGIQKRAARRKRNTSSVDLNLVSLIDIFTILIFFLLINTGVADMLPNSKAIKLPESTAEKAPRETVVVLVSQNDILVDGRKVAAVSDVINAEGDLIPG